MLRITSVFVILLVCVAISHSQDYSRCPAAVPRTPLLVPYDTDGTCMEMIKDEHSWKDARARCKQRGGDLVVIENIQKQFFIIKWLKSLNFDKHGVWIGATDHEKEGDWKWVTGQQINWGFWQNGQGVDQTGFLFGRGGIEDCAIMRVNDAFRWHDYPCGGLGYHYTSICEYRMTPVVYVPTTAMPITQQVITAMPTTQKAITAMPTTQPVATDMPTTYVMPIVTTDVPQQTNMTTLGK